MQGRYRAAKKVLLAVAVAVSALLSTPSGVASAGQANSGVTGAGAAAVGCNTDSRGWARHSYLVGSLAMDRHAQDPKSVIAWSYHGGTNQIWAVEWAAESGYYLHPCDDPGKCLDVSGARYENGVPLLVWTCNGQANQRFLSLAVDRPYIFIRPAVATTKCLNVEGGIITGRRVILWNCDGAPNGKWHEIEA